VVLALNLEDYHPSVLLHCWLGHLTCKIVSEMTYDVSSGTLNPTIPYPVSPVSHLLNGDEGVVLGPTTFLLLIIVTFPPKVMEGYVFAGIGI